MAPAQHSLSTQTDHLAPCPDKPNCVSSQAPPGRAHIAPLEITGPADNAWLTLQDVVVELGGEIQQADDHFLHAIFRSRVFGFIDDLTCSLDDENSLIHIRSAARTGYYDFGVNRKRVEHIRQNLKAGPG